MNVIVYFSERSQCFIRDEGRSFEIGLQEQVSNHHELRWLRANVVSVVGKGGDPLRQVRIKKTSESKLLITCRNVSNDVETGILTSIPLIEVEGNLSTAQPASGMKAA